MIGIGTGITNSLVRREEGGETPASPWLAGGIDPGTVVRAYHAIGAASFEASLVNLANPGNGDAVAEGDEIPWSASAGWLFAENSGYLDTGAQFEEGDTLLVRFDVSENEFNYALLVNTESVGGGTYLGMGPMSDSENPLRSYVVGNGELSLPGYATAGVMGIAGTTAYLDGEAEGDCGPYEEGEVYPLYIGAGNFDGNIEPLWDPHRILAWYHYRAELTPEQVAAVSAAMAGLTE